MALRRAFAAEMRSRFAAVESLVLESIVENDCFAIADLFPTLAVNEERPLRPGVFRFESDEKKRELFFDWVQRVQQEQVFELVRDPRPVTVRAGIGHTLAPPPKVPWTDPLVSRGYERGLASARANLRAAGYSEREVRALPQPGEWVYEPAHRSRVEAVSTRAWDQLKTVQDQGNERAAAALKESLDTRIPAGLARGANPREVAREIFQDVNKGLVEIPRHRAVLIARTETARAHHLAQIASYREVDASATVMVLAEIGLGPEPCPWCIHLEKLGPYTLDEIEDMIPYHPNCVCTALPAVVERSEGAERIARRPDLRPPPRPEKGKPPEIPERDPAEVTPTVAALVRLGLLRPPSRF